MSFKILPPWGGPIHKGCASCSTAPDAGDDGVALAPLDMIIAVGFGSADVTCDGEVDEQSVESGEREDWWTVRDAEAAARLKPDADWRIEKHGPLHGEVYQRQGVDRWVLVESNKGFA